MDDSHQQDSALLPRQIQVGSLPTPSLALPPNQIIFVPVAFLPRFPSESSTLFVRSAAQVDDLIWLANSKRGSNVYQPPVESFFVSTTFIIDTNAGATQLQIKASSRRKNDYSFPDRIRFSEPQTPHSSEKLGRSVIAERSLPHVLDKDADCFDLYIKNPIAAREAEGREHSSLSLAASPDFQVTEVVASNPDTVSLHLTAVDGTLSAELPAIRSWEDSGHPPGALVVPPDENLHYLATVCPMNLKDFAELQENESEQSAGSKLDYDVTPTSDESWMGFLQVRTTHDTIFVSLEYYPKRNFSIRDEQDDDILQVLPQSINLQFTTAGNSSARIPIQIRNSGSESPITIMRMSAVSSMSTQMADLNFSVRLPGDGLDEKNWVYFNETLEDAYFFECSVDWSKFLASSSEVAYISGSVILRGTSALNLNYDDWHSAMMSNPVRESDLVAEIPFQVKLVKGRVALWANGTTHMERFFWSFEAWDDIDVVSATFYPARQDGVRASLGDQCTVDDDEVQSMLHFMRVVSNIESTTHVAKVEVLETVQNVASPLAPESLCRFFSVSMVEPGDPDLSQLTNKTYLGMLRVSYRFPILSAVTPWNATEDKEKPPVVCLLKISTVPDTGSHYIPLIIYWGQLELTDSLSSVAGENATEGKSWHSSSIGFDRIHSWLMSTRYGASFRKLLGLPGKKTDDLSTRLEQYLQNLSMNANTKVQVTMRPILLQVGALAQGEVDSFPLYFTNRNPVPVTISIDVGEVEGLSIVIGRDRSSGKGDGNNLLDSLPRKPYRVVLSDQTEIIAPALRRGPFETHPVNGLRQFLRSDESVSTFFSRYSFRAAVSFSESATESLTVLEKLYRAYSVAEFYSRPWPTHFYPNSRSRCEGSLHPPPFGSFERKPTYRRLPGPVIVSSDGRYTRGLRVCLDGLGESTDKNKSDGTSISLPPGGVVRFDVLLRAPPHSILENDITQFLATGLVLSTSHGDRMPIFVTFEALQGKLIVSPDLTSRTAFSMSSEGVIRATTNLFAKSSTSNAASSVLVPPRALRRKPSLWTGRIVTPQVTDNETGVALYMQSTFSRDVQLRQIISCNPWFEFKLKSAAVPEVDQLRGVEIGVVKNFVPCIISPAGPILNATWQPSFFRCILDSLVNRSDRQPAGCGAGARSTSTKRPLEKDRLQGSDLGGMESALRAFRRALIVSSNLYGQLSETTSSSSTSTPVKSGIRDPEGEVSSGILSVMADAWDSWQAISEFGLNTLSTNLRAVIEYNSSEGDNLPIRSHVLSVALRNLTVESVLETPKLLDPGGEKHQHIRVVPGSDEQPGVVEFKSTHVGGIAWMSIPIRNPTSIPVKVRLSVLPKVKRDDAKFTDDSLSNLEQRVACDESVLSRFTKGFVSPYVQQGDPGRSVQKDGLPSEWWDGSRGFYHADSDGDIIRSRHNVTIIAGPHAVVSLYNPSLVAATALLVGCGRRCAVRDENSPADPTCSTTIGAGAALGFSIAGQGRWSKLQDQDNSEPTAGSLITNGAGLSPFAIPFSALDEIVLPPFGKGSLGPIYFRPPGRFSEVGCRSLSDIKLNNCKTHPFQSLVLLENSLTGLERVILKGKGQVVRLDFVEPTTTDDSEVFGSIELRLGRRTLLFSGTMGNDADAPLAVKEAVLLNSGDVPVRIVAVSLSESGKAEIEHAEHDCDLHGFRVLNCQELNAAFTLSPGENRSIFVQYTPHCKVAKDFVTLSIQVDPDCYASVRPGLKSEDSTPIVSGALLSRYNRANARIESSLLKGINLWLGYEMSPWELSVCRAANDAHRGHYGKRPKARRLLSLHLGILSALLVAFWVVGLRSLSLRIRSSSRLRLVFELPTSRVHIGRLLVSGKGWLAAFRCLARVDPTASELQNLGREQVRHIILARYKGLGVQRPHCLTSAGTFSRERVLTKPGGHGTGEETGNERPKPLSDSVFKRYVPPNEAFGVSPLNMGWPTAHLRALISDRVSELESVSQADRLLKKRCNNMEKHVTTRGEVKDDDYSSSSNDDIIPARITERELVNMEYQEESRSAQPKTPSAGSLLSDAKGQQGVLAKPSPLEPPDRFESFTSSAIPLRSAATQSNPRHLGTTAGKNPLSKKAVGDSTSLDNSPGSRGGNGTRMVKHAQSANISLERSQLSSRRSPSSSRDAEAAAPSAQSTTVSDLGQAISGGQRKPTPTRKLHPKQSPNKGERTRKGHGRGQSGGAAASSPRHNDFKSGKNSLEGSRNAWQAKPDLSSSPLPLMTPIRPPPGLPPPPGFNSAPNELSLTDVVPDPSMPVLSFLHNLDSREGARSPEQLLSMHHRQAARNDLNSPDRLLSQDAFSRSYSHEASDYSTNVPLPLLSASAGHDSPAYQGPSTISPVPMTVHSDHNYDFDIMYFLDGVLNDVNTKGTNTGNLGDFVGDMDIAERGEDSTMLSDDRQDLILAAIVNDRSNRNSSKGSGPALRMDADNAIPLFPHSEQVTANPWAAPTEGRSRLSAYGISIEDVSERTTGVSELLSDLPLFPAVDDAISQVAPAPHDGQRQEGDRTDAYAEFYANLLGED